MLRLILEVLTVIGVLVLGFLCTMSVFIVGMILKDWIFNRGKSYNKKERGN